MHNARLVGQRERACRGRRARARPARRGRLGRPHGPRGRRGLHAVDGDPSTPAGLLAALPPAELITGRATYVVRLWTPVAKVSNASEGTVEAGPRSRHERPAAGPSTDGGGTGEPVPSGAMEATPAIDPRVPVVGAAAGTTRPVDDSRSGPSSPIRRRCRSRSDCANRGRSSRSPSRSSIIAAFVSLNSAQLSKVPEADPRRQRLAGARGIPRLLRGIPVARLALGDPAPRHRCDIATKDSTEIIFLSWLVNCVVPAKLGDVYRAYLLKINSTASLSPNVRDRLHRAGPRPLRDRDAGPRRRLLELPRRTAAGRSRSCSASASSSSPCSAFGLLTMRNFGRRIIVRAAAAAPGPRAVRPVRGGRVRGARAAPPAAPRFADRDHLDDRGPAPLPRRPGAGLRGRVARPVGRGLRRAHRLAADRGAAEPGRARHRRGRVVGVLHVAYGVPLPEATAIALLDRVISVFSIIMFGSIAYVVVVEAARTGRTADPRRLDAGRTAPTRRLERPPDPAAARGPRIDAADTFVLVRGRGGQRPPAPPTTPPVPSRSPSWVARTPRRYQRGIQAPVAPSASSLHRGTERAVTDRTRLAPRSAQAA